MILLYGDDFIYGNALVLILHPIIICSRWTWNCSLVPWRCCLVRSCRWQIDLRITCNYDDFCSKPCLSECQWNVFHKGISS
jgi:hypothetical protein